MRIAIFLELDFGGARRAVNELAKVMKKNYVVDLYLVDEEISKDEGKFFTDVFFYKFIPKKWTGKNWNTRLYKDTIELIKLYNLHKKIASDIKLKKYDYIFVHPSKYTQAPFLLNLIKQKCIYYCQEPLRMVYDPNLSSISRIKFPKNIYEFINRKIRKWIDIRNFKSASIVLTNSNYSKKFIEKSYGRKAEVCYLGVDTNLFKPLDVNKSIDVLFIGNKDKGFGFLEESLKLFKIKPKIHTIFRNKKTEITDEKLVRIYNSSKALVALNQYEPFGLIPLEAMACGTPVIAIGEGGYKESVINRKTGFLISRNSQELYEKINKLINNDELRSNIGRAARKNILKNWTWNKSVDRFLQIIKYAK